MIFFKNVLFVLIKKLIKITEEKDKVVPQGTVNGPLHLFDSIG